jgi:hypothetical protein
MVVALPSAHAVDQQRTITIQAMGTVLADPDRVSISTGVTTEAKTAAEALSKNSAAMTAIVRALKADGIAGKDIQTTNFSVRPRYRNYRDGRPQVVTGYIVTNSVRIRVREIGRLGAVLDSVVSLGSNQIGGIRFHASRADELRDEARKVAFANALRKATVYAQAAGVTLGQVLQISERRSRVNGPVGTFARAARASAMPAPIEAGQQALTVSVHVTWVLK